MIEIVIVGVIMIFVFTYVGAFNFGKFVDDNKALFGRLKEDDYDFFLRSKYGEQVDLNLKFQSRVKTAIISLLLKLGIFENKIFFGFDDSNL